MARRLHLPFAVSSDHEMKLANALDLPTFKVTGMTLQKRLTLICRNGLIRRCITRFSRPVRILSGLWINSYRM